LYKYIGSKPILPPAVTSFIGRESELAATCSYPYWALLQNPS
jgi:hypothetical protein